MGELTTTNGQIVRAFSLAPTSFEQALKFAEIAAASDLVPPDYKGKPANILLALQHGCEIGLAPLQAIQSIAIINGRPALWGDAVLGLVRASGKLESIDETDDGMAATCTVRRRGDQSPVVRTFSQADAEKAGLAKKSGPWSQYPSRMRQLRARAFALRDAFPDVLRGLAVREEIEDYDVETTATETIKPPRRKSERKPAPEPEPQPQPTPQAAASGRETFIGLVRNLDPQTAANGSAYTRVELEGYDGVVMGVFSHTATETLVRAFESGLAVAVEASPTPKGGFKIETAEILADAVPPPSEADAAQVPA